MKKLLDPIANAMTVGFIFIILGSFKIMLSIIKTDLWITLYGVAYFIIGYGLRKGKRWGVNALGGLIVVDFLSKVVLKMMGYTLYPGMFLGLFVNLVLFAWLYSTKHKFKK